jgi:type I restriction enzyme S subunit
MRGYFKYNCVKHVNQASISSKTLAQSVPFIWAPLEQQESIVAELEKQFSRLDEAVANLQRVKANLKRYKASVLKAAVEGRLVETESALANREGRTYKTGEQLLQRTIEARSGGGKARRGKADLAAMPCANVKEIPDGWVWTTTGQVCECIVPNRDKPKTFSGDIPWLTLPDFDDSEITVARSRSGLGFTESEVALYRAKAIPADSVVMSCVGRFGISAVLTRKAVINQQLHAFLPSEGVAPKYLAYVLRTREQEMLEKSTATTIAYLNKENCNSISVPLPPFAEQIRIVAEVDRHVSIIREVEAEVDANLQRAQALRQATLAKAFAPGAQ